MRNNVIALLVLCLLFLGNAYAQENAGPKVCADLPGQTFGTYKFRRVGEAIEILIRSANVTASEAREPVGVASVTASDADCEPVALELHWANGHNNGSNFNVTFLDNNNRLISAKQISAFMTGVLEFPLSSFEAQPVSGSTLSLVAIPSTVTIQAVPPFAAPVNLSYRITRVVRVTPRKEEPEKGEAAEAPRERERGQGNDVVIIHNAVRLIGASRLPLVQIELKTSRPFPVRDMPLQLQIGKRVFVDELSGDYTGRKLTLSLTPELFAELEDGDEIVAFFSKSDRSGSADQDVWHFGKLEKGRRQ
ncbi:MAG TPA: hypothetical protein VGJ55_05945 [Pyrinomonadaceae bacterium]